MYLIAYTYTAHNGERYFGNDITNITPFEYAYQNEETNHKSITGFYKLSDEEAAEAINMNIVNFY